VHAGKPAKRFADANERDYQQTCCAKQLEEAPHRASAPERNDRPAQERADQQQRDEGSQEDRSFGDRLLFKCVC
jgi:hypothetical protein